MQKIGKEIKIGLAVIGVLVAAFGYILFRKLARSEDVAAAPAASATPSDAATTAKAADHPTVVSATETSHPADLASGGAGSSRSLFSSARRPQASEPAESGTDPRGSFMPAANNDVAANNGVATNNVAPANNGVAGNGGAAAAPENRFSQFGQHDPAASKSGATGPATATNAASDKPTNTQKAGDAANNHSLFTGAGSATVSDPTTLPAVTVGGAPSDPFQHKSGPPTDPVADNSLDRHVVSPLDAPTSSAGIPTADPFRQRPLAMDSATAPRVMPPDPSPTQQDALSDSRDGNPLRHSRDGLARPTSVESPDIVASETPRYGFAHRSSQSAMSPTDSSYSPAPITSTAINVPSAQLTPPDPVSPVHQPGQYIVQPNDNYWTVSEKVYGTGGYFKAIYEHNRRRHSQAERLQVGDALDMPDEAMLQRAYPELCPKSDGGGATPLATETPVAASRPQLPGTRHYVVTDGDTLFEIARRELGRSSRWGEIYQLNHDQLGNNFDYLHAGTDLLIPSDRSAASVAREPNYNGGFQR